jgi:hypothetical protein
MNVYTKTIISPRQARDKYRKRGVFCRGGSFHGPIATRDGAVVFNVGASFDNKNHSSHGCLLDGDEWRLGSSSPYVKTGAACASGVGYTGRVGHVITAAPPSARNVTVGFTSLLSTGDEDSAGGPDLYSMQKATSGSVRVRPGATSARVTLAGAMTGKYQVLASATFPAGGVWIPRANRTRSSFVVEWERPAPAATDSGGEEEIDWAVRAAPWPGNPTPGT